MANGARDYRGDTEAQDAFRARMQDQCCLIERYRLGIMKNEGRDLSRDEAALEWIQLHAESFSRGDSA